ncbi:MAG: class I SAM-dependent methyltransferase [Candidatus Odinarchaeota archaeon]|nr:class I SAM-dependent methyltransferase [Candidatus Odinarchaeota archaeon]
MIRPYDKYSEVYDFLFEDEIDYDKDIVFVKEIIDSRNYKEPVTILDLGCGTGTHAIKFAKAGFNVIGIDISESMIKRAVKKAKNENVNIEFLVQDMRKINIPREIDCVVSFFGSFAYLLTDDDLKEFFNGLNKCLRKEGLLIIDLVNREGASRGHFLKWRLKEKGNKIVIRLSESELDEATGLIRGTYQFFVIENNYLIDRFTENHIIRTYTLDDIRRILKENRYNVLGIYSLPELDNNEDKVKRSFTVRVVAEKHV